MAVSLASLIVSATKATILQKMLDVASAIGLVTESWQPGDPTRSLFYSTAARFEEWESEDKLVGFIKSGFLGLASGDWLALKVEQDYNVTKRAATYATCTVRITNTTAAFYGAIAANDIVVSNITTGKTYRNTSTGVLGAGVGAYVDLDFEAEEAGTESNSGIGTITTLVTPSDSSLTVSNTTAAVATDAESDDEVRARAQAKLEALSPNGPKGAYHYVATTPELQSDGLTNVTRTRVIADSSLGEVTVYLAGASGAVAAGDVTKATDTIDTYATPLCVSVTVASGVNKTIAITYTLWVYDTIGKTSSEIQTIIADYLAAAFKTRPIGGDVTPPATTGSIYKDWIEAQILAAVYPFGYRVSVSAPSGDTAMAINEVAVLGVITPTINQVQA